MDGYSIGKVAFSDQRSLTQLDKLLEREGIRRDPNLDYLCAMFDEDFNIIATGACFGNTLRCLAVSSDHQGEGVMNQIITHLVNVQIDRGHSHLFLYTKCESAKFFHDLGFREIVQIPNQIVFMENKRNGFEDYLTQLKNETAKSAVQNQGIFKEKRTAAIVMNANPFTLGHQYLVEKAAGENDIVHLFILSEDCSLFPYSVRKKLIQAGIAHLPNVVLHDSGSYIISQATFPSYFQKSDDAAIKSNVEVDLQIFVRIAQTLGIQCRYVGDEPFSHVTNLYNQTMQQKLPEYGVACIVVTRKETDENVISASAVRQAIKDKNWSEVKKFVPQSTFDFLMSDEAAPIVEKIQQITEDVKHY
ncbi:[citrate (pro-3S)-lyase] ligase [Rodentibacter pneumotropicus]|uniref:[citrate (pro-3S)-lyase] ligase n=1 Tax=Rodentibacter pneumotropicus TaxID=758 RepID=UPI00109C27DD|nr:[citrate (pro-3S)-lyase] ligase [Rodentibacter pneumotropicus]NBH76456.1 [citrate (pro-3S)-lyase] ligase [Rodentibacter pneumotropicus]THA06772.1 [citrate (pro-3S)-lyase] ligase [Rodentibacter pneumotropicus]THA11236.1 [citrate (pro-3S)-lyase] ligase [Rodentibacter pneumotropicus]